jgi:uncharacterized protein
MQKLKRLREILADMGSAVLAYSGGVDSTFLLRICKDVFGRDVLAVTASSETYPEEELSFARRVAVQLGVRHRVVKTRELKNALFQNNPANRCYYCKRELFGRLARIAQREKLKFVIDASSLSDSADYRPGTKAKKELGVRSPLQEAGLDKGDIRRYSKQLRLPTWEKPSLACLASRIPYGEKITPFLLTRINDAERFLRGKGCRQVRVRDYRDACRIEVAPEDMALLLRNRGAVVRKFKKLGYVYITFDLEGYRTGSMNALLPDGIYKR